MNTYSELKRKPQAELQADLVKTRKELQETEFAVSSGQEKHVRKIRQLKQLIAQILTALNSKDQDGKAN